MTVQNGRTDVSDDSRGSFSYTLNNDTFKKLFGKKDDEKKDKDKKDTDDEDEEETDDEMTQKNNSGTRKTENATLDPDGYLAFKLPWSLSLSYSYSIREDRTKQINIKTMRYPYSLTHSLNISGSRWNVTYSSGYDFTSKEMSMTTVNITRDLHCFNLSASLSPFGRWKYYNVTIRANASILQDLKYEQRSQTQSNIQWY